MPTMKAVQVSKAGGRFELVDREIPQPAAGQVRIRVEACGMCHSDAFVRGGQFPGLTLPRIPGHEIAGRIDAIGPGVTSWQPGQRVGVGWHGGHCFVCTACRKGDFLNCAQAKITGISFDGGYAEYMVAPAAAVARMPDGLEAADAGPLLCAGITTFNALRHSGARPGDTVAISRGADKEALARELGAHEYVDTAKTTAADGLRELGGAHLVLATAPHSEAIASTVDGLRARGKLLIVAAPQEPLAVSALALLSGRSIAGWPSGTSIDSEEAIAFSALTGVRPRIERFKLAQAEQAFAKMMANEVRFRAVLEP